MGSVINTCSYCTSDNEAVREIYFDMNCPGCALRFAALEKERRGALKKDLTIDDLE